MITGAFRGGSRGTKSFVRFYLCEVEHSTEIRFKRLQRIVQLIRPTGTKSLRLRRGTKSLRLRRGRVDVIGY